MEVPSWPSGRVKLDGDTLEFGAGDLTRVPVADVKKFEVGGSAKGRLSLKIEYQAGLNQVKTSAWVEEQHEAELNELVGAVQSAMGSG
jgi:hypothetical protein